MLLMRKCWQVLHKSDYRYFEKARQVAMISDFYKIHIGCVAIYQNNIIGIGCNTNKTHPMQLHYNRYRNNRKDSNQTFTPKLHAEINCINSIRHMNIDFSKVKLYIYRIANDRPCRISRPCPSCMEAIKDIGIRQIYYTTNDGYAYEKIGGDEVCANIA